MEPKTPEEKAALQTLEADWENELAFLKELIALPTVSFDPWPKEPLFECAAKIEAELAALGPDELTRLRAPAVPEDAVPVLFAHWKAPAGAKTVLLYAHYDVQPPMDPADWTTPPFEPHERGGRLYARGSADDKAGIVLHLAALRAWKKSLGKLPCGVKILFEGQEEIGSANLEELLRRNAALLEADAVVIADCGNAEVGTPTLTTSLRGMNALDVEARALRTALHSGSWGGIAPDVGLILARAVASLADDWGRPTFPIPGWDPRTAPARALPVPDRDRISGQIGLLPGTEFPFPLESLWAHNWFEPAVAVTAMECGRVGESGNVIHPVAKARIGLRVPAGCDVGAATEALEKALRAALPAWVGLRAEPEDAASPWEADAGHPLMRLAAETMSEAYGKETVFAGCGASIPLAKLFGELLPGIPVLLTGVEDPLSAVHAPDESLELADFFSGAKAETALFGRLSD